MNYNRKYIYSLGRVCVVDKQGQLNIPEEILDEIYIRNDSKLEILIDNNDDIILRKLVTKCESCGRKASVFRKIRHIYVCPSCYRKINLDMI